MMYMKAIEFQKGLGSWRIFGVYPFIILTVVNNNMNVSENRAVLNDPSIYHDPSSFNPDRFDPTLGEAMEMDPTSIAFCLGLGRRYPKSLRLH